MRIAARSTSISELGGQAVAVQPAQLRNSQPGPCNSQRTCGFILVAVIVVVAMVALIGGTMMFRMQAEAAASAVSAGGQQGRAAAMSGILRALAVVSADSADRAMWWDNEALFKNQLVRDDGNVRWYFTVFADKADDGKNVRFGLIDEAAKINVNAASSKTLLAMPNMTQELVDCLLDYIDSDSETRPSGAEQDYYDRLDYPYIIKNGNLATLEELLLVKGFGTGIVFGEDANLNGTLESNEDDGEWQFPSDDADGRLNTGLRGFATAVTYENDTDSQGQPLVDLNGDAQALEAMGLNKRTFDFIKIYREAGNFFTHPSQLLNMKFSELDSGVTAEGLPLIMGRLTAKPPARGADEQTPDTAGPPEPPMGTRIGLVNVNTAGTDVLAAMEGLDAALVQRIVETRDGLDPQTLMTTAWLFTEGVLTPEQFKKVAPLLTTRSFQFRVLCVGFGVPVGRFCVMEAVLDLAGPRQQVVYLRDITRLGLPFAIDTDQLEH
ncbi:MAG: general secretion pathway protein GspK [Planctomycetes bacterium]|nr:general secretion pathway protein GspK [Planctomycetota bacterium]